MNFMPFKGTVKSIAKNAEDNILEEDKSDRPLPNRPHLNRPLLNRPFPQEGISSGLYKNLNDDEWKKLTEWTAMSRSSRQSKPRNRTPGDQM